MVTQEQIAAKLGISRQLVTLALTGHPNVSAKSRERIVATARKMGYVPNPHARALKRGRTGIIALWIPNQYSLHYAHVSQELNRLVRREQYELVTIEMSTVPDKQVLSYIPMDGIFVVDSLEDARPRLQSLGNNTTPVIFMGAEHYEKKSDYIHIDLFEGAEKLMAHLIGNGFRRIVHVTCVDKNEPNATRRRAYLQAMREAKLKPDIVYFPKSEQQRPLVRQLIREYVAKEGVPEAFFCHSDDVALGVYRGLSDMKLRVPQDVAIAGCDGIQDTEYLETPITTIVQPVKEMCATAWRFLQQRLELPEQPPQHVVLTPELSIRESTERRK